MKIFEFGSFDEKLGYRVLNERVVRATSGIMFLLGLVAFIKGVFLGEYDVIPYISGFLFLNFLISILINPKFSPINILSLSLVLNQKPILIGAIQKRFAWTLGAILSLIIFLFSLQLVHDIKYFEIVCNLCLLCLFLLFSETAFGVCIGCKLYNLFILLKIIKEPSVKPNCIGDSCNLD